MAKSKLMLQTIAGRETTQNNFEKNELLLDDAQQTVGEMRIQWWAFKGLRKWEVP